MALSLSSTMSTSRAEPGQLDHEAHAVFLSRVSAFGVGEKLLYPTRKLERYLRKTHEAPPGSL
jgi:hypothetical protein